MAHFCNDLVPISIAIDSSNKFLYIQIPEKTLIIAGKKSTLSANPVYKLSTFQISDSRFSGCGILNIQTFTFRSQIILESTLISNTEWELAVARYRVPGSRYG